MRGAMIVCTALTAALVLFLMGYVLINGIPNITWELLSTKPSYLTERIGILPDILNTVYIVLATLVIVLPLGVGAAIYLTEYAKNKKLVAMIEYAAETLSGIPSIIYGLVGMLLFSNNFGTSLLAGALTLVIMNLPTVMRTTQESLKTVPQSYREGAFGLGAGKWRVIRTVVLPGCVDGVITGCILSVGRIIGESAALLWREDVDIHLEQFAGINTLVDELLDAGHCAFAVGSIGDAKPLRGSVEHLDRCGLLDDEFVDHQGDEELGLEVLHVLRIAEELLELGLRILEVVGGEAPHVHGDRGIVVDNHPLALLVLITDGL